MHIGDQVRMLTVEPIVDPVPDGDFTDRPAEMRPPAPRPRPRSARATTPRPVRRPVPERV